MFKNYKYILLSLSLLFTSEGKAQLFNKRFIFDKTSAHFLSIKQLSTDRLVLIGGGTTDYYPFPYKNLFLEYSIGGEFFIKESFPILDSFQHYFTNTENAKQLNDSSWALVGVSSPKSNYYDKGLLIRLKKDFTVMYYKEYPRPLDNPDYESFELTDFVELKDKTLLLLGTYYDYEPQYHSDLVLLKTDSLGNELWRKVIGKPNLDEYSQRILPLTDTSFLLIGNQGILYPNNPHNASGYLYTLSVDTSGTVLNEWKTIDKNIFISNDIAPIGKNNYLICSAFRDKSFYNTNINQGYSIFYGDIRRVDSNFKTIWELKLGVPTTPTNFNDILPLKDGNFLITGSAFDSLNDRKAYRHEGWLVKVTPEGKVLWERRYYSMDNDTSIEENDLNDAIELPNGDLMICGVSTDHTGDYPQRGWLLKLNSEGCLKEGCGNVGIEEYKHEAYWLKMYPNPTENMLNLVLSLPTSLILSEFSLNIVDVLGKEILKVTTLNSDHITIPLTDFPTGTYWVSIWNRNKRVITNQFQKQ